MLDSLRTVKQAIAGAFSNSNSKRASTAERGVELAAMLVRQECTLT